MTTAPRAPAAPPTPLRRFLPLAIFLLISAVLVACFTLRETERPAGYSREAQLNPWLAAGRLLEARGLSVQPSPAYSRVPAHADVIVLASSPVLLAPEVRTALMDWVEDGGHLVFPASDSADQAEWLKPLGLRVRTGSEDNEDEGAENAPEALARLFNIPSRTLEIPGEGWLKVSLYDPAIIAARTEPLWGARDDKGWRLLRQPWGDGRVTVVTDLGWVSNRHIGTNDHAALFWRLVDAEPGHDVMLVHGADQPSLLSLLMESAAPLLLAVAVFVVVWLWQSAQRFGPLTERAPPVRRRLSEHLEAAGRHLYRLGRSDLLLDASRQRLLADVQRRHPQWRRLPSAELAVQLGRRAGLEPAAIVRVLQHRASSPLLQLAADLRLINRLRKAL
ncbi:MAG: DUF4350 domain-containing protein [Moraxellaceae bacterium]|nr:DUF4350 domain-containing protein [Moraxellaceae bacterium]